MWCVDNEKRRMREMDRAYMDWKEKIRCGWVGWGDGNNAAG